MRTLSGAHKPGGALITQNFKSKANGTSDAETNCWGRYSSSRTELEDPYQLDPMTSRSRPTAFCIAPAHRAGDHFRRIYRRLRRIDRHHYVGRASRLYGALGNCAELPDRRSYKPRWALHYSDWRNRLVFNACLPRLKVNWVVWAWALMTLLTMLQVGAMLRAGPGDESAGTGSIYQKMGFDILGHHAGLVAGRRLRTNRASGDGESRIIHRAPFSPRCCWSMNSTSPG